MLMLVLLGGFACIPDVAQLMTLLWAVSAVCLIGSAIVLVVGVKDHWGVLPEFNFTRTVEKATSTPIASALVLMGFMIFLGLMIIAVFKAS